VKFSSLKTQNLGVPGLSTLVTAVTPLLLTQLIGTTLATSVRFLQQKPRPVASTNWHAKRPTGYYNYDLDYSTVYLPINRLLSDSTVQSIHRYRH